MTELHSKLPSGPPPGFDRIINSIIESIWFINSEWPGDVFRDDNKKRIKEVVIYNVRINCGIDPIPDSLMIVIVGITESVIARVKRCGGNDLYVMKKGLKELMNNDRTPQ